MIPRLRAAMEGPIRTGAAIDRLRLAPMITEISGRDVIAMRAPLVYEWVRAGRLLYVGKGETGLCRPLNPVHHRLSLIEPTDTLRIYRCDTAAEACALEQQLIQHRRPELNRETKEDRKRRAARRAARAAVDSDRR